MKNIFNISNSYLDLTYGSWKLQELALVEHKCFVVEVWRFLASEFEIKHENYSTCRV